MSRAEQAGRRLGEAINEMVHLMYNEQTKIRFFRGILDVLGRGSSKCFTCREKSSCKHYGIVIDCDECKGE